MARKKRAKTKQRRAKTEWLGATAAVGLEASLVVWVDRRSGDVLDTTLCRAPKAAVELERAARRLIEQRGKPNGRLCVPDRVTAERLRAALRVPVGGGFDQKADDLVWDALETAPCLDAETTITLDGGEAMYTLDATLRNIEPPIRRRIRVAGDASLETLHLVLQLAMGWDNCHLHQFDVGGEHYGYVDEETGGDDLDEREFQIQQLLRKGDRATYWYDFGDDWMHDLVVLDVSDAKPGDPVASCIDGARACPPEDAGGPWGYQDKLRAVAAPQDDDDHELAAWLGDDFDPEAFDREATDAALKALFVVGGDDVDEDDESDWVEDDAIDVDSKPSTAMRSAS